MAGMSYKAVPSSDEVLVGLSAKSLLDLNKIVRDDPALSAKELVAFLEECYDKTNRENKPRRWWG